MEKESTTSGAAPGQLTELLRKGMDVDGEDAASIDQRKADFLRFRLCGALRPKSGQAEARSAFLAHARRTLLPLEGRSLGEVLLDERAALDGIKAIKDYGKKLSACKDREVQHDAAIAIYHAAIANALVFRGKRISTFSYPHLAGAFTTLKDKPWMDPKLARLFAKAARICRKRRRWVCEPGPPG